MNKIGSITEYRKKLESNFFFKLSVLSKFKLHKKQIIATIDKKGFKIIKDKYIDVAPAPGYSKYLDIDLWIMRNLWHVYLLGLQDSSSKMVLDIGTGCGFFPYICRFFGHEIKTIDITIEPIFNEIIKFFDIERLEFEVKEYQPLPNVNKRFDLVTGFMIYFNNHKKENIWGPKEWSFFLEDLIKNHLTSHAEAFFTLNTEPHNNKWYDNELYRFFIESGAEVDGERIYYKNLSYFG